MALLLRKTSRSGMDLVGIMRSQDRDGALGTSQRIPLSALRCASLTSGVSGVLSMPVTGFRD